MSLRSVVVLGDTLLEVYGGDPHIQESPSFFLGGAGNAARILSLWYDRVYYVLPLSQFLAICEYITAYSIEEIYRSLSLDTSKIVFVPVIDVRVTLPLRVYDLDMQVIWRGDYLYGEFAQGDSEWNSSSQRLRGLDAHGSTLWRPCSLETLLSMIQALNDEWRRQATLRSEECPDWPDCVTDLYVEAHYRQSWVTMCPSGLEGRRVGLSPSAIGPKEVAFQHVYIDARVPACFHSFAQRLRNLGRAGHATWKLNRREADSLTAPEVSCVEKAAGLREHFSVLLTLGDKGGLCFPSFDSPYPLAYPSMGGPGRDPTGAGDAFFSTYAGFQSMGATTELSLRAGSVAGGIVAQIPGSTPITKEAVRQALLQSGITDTDRDWINQQFQEQ